MKKQSRPKRKRMRLSGWDYSRPGAYFVTLCTQSRESFFVNKEIRAVVEAYWLRLREKYIQVELDAFVIMLDHLHGIILIHEDGHAPPNVPLGRMMHWFNPGRPMPIFEEYGRIDGLHLPSGYGREGITITSFAMTKK